MWLGRRIRATASQMSPPQKAIIMSIIGIHHQPPPSMPLSQYPLCISHLHVVPSVCTVRRTTCDWGELESTPDALHVISTRSPHRPSIVMSLRCRSRGASETDWKVDN